MSEKNISHKFRLKNIVEIRIVEINRNQLMSKKHEKFIEF